METDTGPVNYGMPSDDELGLMAKLLFTEIGTTDQAGQTDILNVLANRHAANSRFFRGKDKENTFENIMRMPLQFEGLNYFLSPEDLVDRGVFKTNEEASEWANSQRDKVNAFSEGDDYGKTVDYIRNFFQTYDPTADTTNRAYWYFSPQAMKDRENAFQIANDAENWAGMWQPNWMRDADDGRRLITEGGDKRRADGSGHVFVGDPVFDTAQKEFKIAYNYIPKTNSIEPVLVEEPVITAEATSEAEVSGGPLSNNPIITSMDYFNDYASPTYDLNFLSNKLQKEFQKVRTDFINWTTTNPDYDLISEEGKKNLWRKFLQLRIERGEIQAEAAMKLDSGDIVGIGANRGLSSVPNINSMEVPPMYYAKGTDTVPAMLTPGEAVIPREAAQHPAYKPIIQEMISTGRQMQDVMDDEGMFNMAASTENPYGWPSESYEADYYNSKVLGSPRPKLGYWYAPGHYNQGTDDVGKRMIDQWINAAKMTRINRDEGPFPMDITGEAWKEFEEPVDPYANTLLDSGKVKKDHEAMLARERALARRNTPGSPIAKFGPGPLGNRVPKLDDIGVPVSNMTTEANEIKMSPDFAPFIEGNIAPQDEFGVPLSNAVTTPIEQEAGPSMPPFLEHPSLKDEEKEGYVPAFDLNKEYTGPYKKDPLRNVKALYNGLSWLFGGTWNDNWGNKKKKEEEAKLEKALAEGFVPREYTEERLGGQIPPPSDYFSTNVEGEFPIIDDDTGIKAGFNEENGTVELTSTQPLYNKDGNINLPSQETLDAIFKNNGQGQNTPTGIFKWIEDNLGFTKQDALRALVFYAGGRLAGGSHKGSLQWAGKRVLQEYDNRLKTQAALGKSKLTAQGKTVENLQQEANKRIAAKYYTREGEMIIRDALLTQDPTTIYGALMDPKNFNPLAEEVDLTSANDMRLKTGFDKEVVYQGADGRGYYKIIDNADGSMSAEKININDYVDYSADILDNLYGKVTGAWDDYFQAYERADKDSKNSANYIKLKRNLQVKDAQDFRNTITNHAHRYNINPDELLRRVTSILDLIKDDEIDSIPLDAALTMLTRAKQVKPDFAKMVNLTQPHIDETIERFGGNKILTQVLQATDKEIVNAKKEDDTNYTVSDLTDAQMEKVIGQSNLPDALKDLIRRQPNPYWKYVYLMYYKNPDQYKTK